MVFIKKQKLTKPEKNNLLFRFFNILIFLPFLNAIGITLIYLLFIPFLPILPSEFEPRSVNSFEKYFEELWFLTQNIGDFFLMILAFGLIYFYLKNYILMLDLLKDYFKSYKYLGKFTIIGKRKLLNRYLIKTTNPNFTWIKVNKKIYSKIEPDSKAELVISSSKRAYRYNPLIVNFEIDKLI